MEDVMRTVFSATRDRAVGYAQALRAAEIDVARVPMFETQNDAATVGAALEQIFASAEPPTAILAESDKIALLALDWFAARGVSVPGDVSIVGFDGVPEGAESTPPLTTMAQPIAEIGRRAVKLIIEAKGRPRRQAVDVDLVVRGSTAPPKAEDRG